MHKRMMIFYFELKLSFVYLTQFAAATAASTVPQNPINWESKKTIMWLSSGNQKSWAAINSRSATSIQDNKFAIEHLLYLLYLTDTFLVISGLQPRFVSFRFALVSSATISDTVATPHWQISVFCLGQVRFGFLDCIGAFKFKPVKRWFVKGNSWDWAGPQGPPLRLQTLICTTWLLGTRSNW